MNLACTAVFNAQPAEYRAAVLGSAPRVTVEAGATAGLERYVGERGAAIGIDRFGASAPGKVVSEKLGLNVANLVAVARSVLG